MQYPMHYHQHMGYPIIYHQRIAVPTHFIHSGILFHIQFFYPQQIKNLTSPTPAKNCCQVLPTPLEDAQMPNLSGFSDFCPAYLSSPKEASGNAETAFLGASAMHEFFFKHFYRNYVLFGYWQQLLLLSLLRVQIDTNISPVPSLFSSLYWFSIPV